MFYPGPKLQYPSNAYVTQRRVPSATLHIILNLFFLNLVYLSYTKYKSLESNLLVTMVKNEQVVEQGEETTQELEDQNEASASMGGSDQVGEQQEQVTVNTTDGSVTISVQFYGHEQLLPMLSSLDSKSFVVKEMRQEDGELILVLTNHTQDTEQDVKPTVEERIAGRRKTAKSKEAAPADNFKPKVRVETILQEKQRIAGRSKNIRSKELASVDDVANESSNDRVETILQEKQRIAGRSKHIKSKEPSIASNFANEFPGAVRIAGPGANSSDVERQATIMIGSDSNVVANATEENNEEAGIIEETILTAFRVDEETSGEILQGLPISDVVDPTTERKKNRRRVCLWVSSTIVLVGLAIGLSLGLGGKTTALPPTSTPTTSPEGISFSPMPPTIDTVVQRGTLRCGVTAVDALAGLHSFNVDLVSAPELKNRWLIVSLSTQTPLSSFSVVPSQLP
jgi:hypothetical protein